MTGAAFFVLVWIFAVQSPDGKVQEGALSSANKMTAEQCAASGAEMRERKFLEQQKPKRGKILYNRFLCVRLPQEGIPA